MSKFCTKCGKLLSDDSLFCSACGKKQEEVVDQSQEIQLEIFTPQTNEVESPSSQTNSVQFETVQASVSAQSDNKSKLFSKSPYSTPTIIKQFLICLLSIIMFLTVFLPVKTVVAEYDNDEVKVGITPIDSIVFLFDSFSSLSADEIKDTDLYDSLIDDAEELMDELADNDGELNNKSRALFAKIVKKYARLSIMSENYKPAVMLFVIAIFSLFYIIVSLLFLIYSVLKLLNVLIVINKKVYPKTYGLAGIVFASFIGLYTAFSIDSASFTSGISLYDFEIVTGAGVILGMIAFALIFTSLIAIRFFCQKSLKVFNPVKSVLTAVVSILLIILCLGPTFSAEVKTTFSGESNKKTVSVDVYADVYNSMVSTDDLYDLQETFEDLTKSQVTEYIEHQLSKFERYTAREVKKGEANDMIFPMITWSYFMTLGDFGFVISNLAPILVTLINFASAYVLTLVLISFMSNDNDENGQKRAKTFALISMILYTLLNMALVIVVNSFYSTFMKNTFTLSLSITNIFALIVAIILKCIDIKRRNITTNRFDFYRTNVNVNNNF